MSPGHAKNADPGRDPGDEPRATAGARSKHGPEALAGAPSLGVTNVAKMKRRSAALAGISIGMTSFARTKMSRPFFMGLMTLVFAAVIPVPSARAAPPTIVTTGSDSGPGSLREALTSGASFVVISDEITQIEIDSPLVYSKKADLRIVGSGQTLLTDKDHTLLVVKQGANLSISNLDFRGAGDFNATSKGDGKGIVVNVPIERTGVVSLELENVSVYDVANHGIHISDCTLEDDCGSGGGGGGEGSPASIHARLTQVFVVGAGYGRFDADGVRIDERGLGSIVLAAKGSSFSEVGADGVELDEGGEGDVIVDVRDSSFTDNGAYCVAVEADPELDPSCIEEGKLDLDDGFDVDEAAQGSIYATFVNSSSVSNLDEGLDIDEQGAGDIVGDLVGIYSAENGDAGVKHSEEDGGDVTLEIRSISLLDNEDDGAQLESEDSGRIDVGVRDAFVAGSKKKGLKIAQDDEDEAGTLELLDSDISDGIELTNVEMI